MSRIGFYNFNKRYNSTKRLSNTDTGVFADFVYKDSSDINNPTLLLNTNPSSYNYAAIGDMHFFIDSVTTVRNNLWEVRLRNDLLSNHKADILATKAFVMYSDNNYDTALIDSRIKTTGEYARQTNSVTMGEFGSEGYSGMYYLTCIGNPNKNSGGWSATYGFSKDGLIQLLNKFYSDSAWEQLQKFFANPESAIIEAYWLPFQIDKITNYELTFVDIGKWESGIAGILITDVAKNIVNESTIDIPWQSNDFRRLRPYSTLEVFIPTIGLIELDPATFYSYDKITISRVTDPATGKIVCNIYGGGSASGSPLVTVSGDVKVNLPVGQTQSRLPAFIGAVSGALGSAAVGAISGGEIGAIASGGLSLINGVVNAARYTVAYNGGYTGSTVVGSLSPHNISCRVTAASVRPSPNSLIGTQGRTCLQNILLSTCTGYTQTIGASVISSTAHADEITAINAMLNSGVFIE